MRKVEVELKQLETLPDQNSISELHPRMHDLNNYIPAGRRNPSRADNTFLSDVTGTSSLDHVTDYIHVRPCS